MKTNHHPHSGFFRPAVAMALLAGLMTSTSIHANTAPEPQAKPETVQRFELRDEVMREHGHIVRAMLASEHAGFGGDVSYAIANRMASRTDPAAIADARDKLRVETHGDGTWFLRLPWVNIAVFETSEGLVLVDTGYAPAGPALVDTLRQLSDKPVHTIIYSHHHLDHAYGTWALIEAGESPRIIAEERFLQEMGLDIRLADYANAQLNSQDPRDVPRSWDDVYAPTETFRDHTTLTIGGEDFVLNHARGETADHVWVHVPSRDVVVTGDLHQPFLPNAGNGKRRQRYVQEWADALREMAALEPGLLLPMHGPAMTEAAEIQNKLDVVASAFEAISSQVIDGLNAGMRQDQVVASVTLPAELQNHPQLDTYYNTVADIARMVVREYSGWWDGIPSHWAPASRQQQGRVIMELAGGVDGLVEHARELLDTDPVLASHLADWALHTEPDNAAVLQLGIDTYSRRIQPGLPLQEINVYLSHLVELKWRLQALQQTALQ
ncbi:MBL fold metallo-hydrolase [Kineobactrum sediminis]|uniref:MBL fold metallo-hydrolase n=1 Tax=Kineobactrum sediminis TaxID=1905677 RepID=A0A2N5Y4B6_9GAMM|nr:alkyl sulfatase dimerization domain-containing protein [Kineobactrum sediminis]PLW83245.1 MBL fold metallo-hydrolase [Kineobactrum sediminis]